MKLLKLLVLCAMVLMATLGASYGAPASILAAAPGPAYPTGNELLYTYSSGIEFQWTSAGSMAAVSYDIEISTDPSFLNTAPSVMVDSNDGRHTASNCHSAIQPTNYPSSYAYLPATTYYWRIQAYSNATCTGDFTTGGSGWGVYSFRTAILAPSLVSPLSGTLSDNLHNDLSTTPPHPLPLFQWTSVNDASGYILQVSTVATFSSLYIDVSVPTSDTFNGGLDVGYSPSSDLAANTLFYWRVETLNSTYGPSAWSSTPGACVSGYCSFTSADVSAAPVPISNNITSSGVYKFAKVTTDFTPGLRWNEVALPAASTFYAYEVEVSTDNTFADTSQLCFDVATAVPYLENQTYNNDSTLTYAQLDSQDGLVFLPAGTNCPWQTSSGGYTEFKPVNAYYWRVRAYFNGGAAVSDWSTVFEFKTSYAKVDSSTFSAVINGTGSNRYIAFTWPPVSPKPYNYDIQVCFDATFGEGDCILAKNNVSSPFNWRPSAKQNVASGTTLYWRVRADGPWGPGLWSDFDPVHSLATAP